MPKELGENQTTTKEFISLISENTNLDLQWFFDVYVYQNKLPVLNIMKTKEDMGTFLDLWWENKGFKMPIKISYSGINGKVNRKLFVNNQPTRIALLSDEKYVLDPEGWLLFTKNFK